MSQIHCRVPNFVPIGEGWVGEPSVPKSVKFQVEQQQQQ